jgi:hypothetical protein
MLNTGRACINAISRNQDGAVLMAMAMNIQSCIDTKEVKARG